MPKTLAQSLHLRLRICGIVPVSKPSDGPCSRGHLVYGRRARCRAVPIRDDNEQDDDADWDVQMESEETELQGDDMQASETPDQKAASDYASGSGPSDRRAHSLTATNPPQPRSSSSVGIPEWALPAGITAAAVILMAVYGRKAMSLFQQALSTRTDSDAPTEDLNDSGESIPVATYTPSASRSQLEAEARQALSQYIDVLRSVERVSLAGKNLRDEGVEYIAEGLAFNATCRVLVLGGNGVGGRACQRLAEVLQVNEALEELDLSMNGVDDDGAAALAAALTSNRALRILRLAANRIGDAGVAALAEALRVNVSLTELDLGSNEAEYDGALALAKALADNRTLRALSLSDNYITGLGSAALVGALAQNSGLRRLSLKGCDLGDTGAARLADALTARSSPIEDLDLSNNGITSEGFAHVATVLRSQPLKRLNLHLNECGDRGVDALAEALAACPTLEFLDIGGNNLHASGAEALMAALTKVEGGQLSHLAMGYNPLGPDGTQAVIEAVKFQLPLKTLSLEWCKIGGEKGSAAIAQLLQFNESLQNLDLRGNELGNNGAMIIGRAMRAMSNARMQRLDLGLNNIADDGVFTVANAVKNNPENLPAVICLTRNVFSNAGKVALVEATDHAWELFQIEVLVET